MSEEEKPLDLRDRLAMEILNGMLSNSEMSLKIGSVIYSLLNKTEPFQMKSAEDSVEILIRVAYKMADMVRKIRLSSFE